MVASCATSLSSAACTHTEFSPRHENEPTANNAFCKRENGYVFTVVANPQKIILQPKFFGLSIHNFLRMNKHIIQHISAFFKLLGDSFECVGLEIEFIV